MNTIENGICDFFDLFLVWVKEWYDADGNEDVLLNDKNWHKMRFCVFSSNHESYFEKFGDFEKYCNYNFLNNYVDENYAVKSMFGNLNDRQKGGKDAVPKNDNEIAQFLARSREVIGFRAMKMAEKLKCKFDTHKKAASE